MFLSGHVCHPCGKGVSSPSVKCVLHFVFHVVRCLHDFKPHKGAAVTRLLFCDNHLCQDPSNQFWRFLVTASQETGEMKIWCTVNWKCLQTIRSVSLSVNYASKIE